VAGCLLVVAGLCLGIILYVLRPILIPFSVAVLFYYLLQPLVNALNNVRACVRAFAT
jgi:predicted PurR-regulated permease PerM